MGVTRAKIEANLSRIRDNVADACARSGRDPEGIGLVAVTKAVDFDAVKLLLDAGVTSLGENRVQQLVERADAMEDHLARRRNELPAPVAWHMVGHLQRNKVRHVLDVPRLAMIHSVDSLRLAEEISSRAGRAGQTVRVLMEVNCSQEEQKHGVAVGAATHLAEMIAGFESLRLCGLMTMAPLVDDPENARASFARLRELFEEMQAEKIGGDDFRVLSMGMSQDYPVAVEEGATLLRIGTALFE